MRHAILVPLMAATAVFAIVTFHRSARGAEQVSPTQLRAVVDRHFSTYPDYRPGDLILRRDVEPIVNALIQHGAIEPASTEDLYKAFLPNRSPLVQMLQTQAGKVFMRKVSNMPEVYDRLERLAWMPQGRELLAQLIANPEGDKMLAKLLSEEGIQALSVQFADDSRIENFLLPTGHVHTTDELIAELETIVGTQPQ